MAGQVEGGREVGTHHLIPMLGRDLQIRLLASDADVGHHDIHRAKVLGARVHQPGHLRIDAHVGHDAQGLATLGADLVDHPIHRGAVAVPIHHHLRALGGQ